MHLLCGRWDAVGPEHQGVVQRHCPLCGVTELPCAPGLWSGRGGSKGSLQMPPPQSPEEKAEVNPSVGVIFTQESLPSVADAIILRFIIKIFPNFKVG